jgi:hypothetical protein
MKNIDDMTNAELDVWIDEEENPSGDVLLTRVHKFLGRFVGYPSVHAQVAHALWIVHTHMMDQWDSTPRIAFLSPEPGSGKTRAIEITMLLTPNSVSSIGVSTAYLFRKIGSGAEEGQPVTIGYDEVDTVFGPKAKEHEEIRALLNSGHRKGAFTGRCVIKGKTVETEEIPSYAAVALAGLGNLPDTILTRSIVVRMRKRKQAEKITPYRKRFHEPGGHALRDKLAAWAASVNIVITEAWPEIPEGIEDRDADIWESLLAIADTVGGSWPERARAAAVSFVTASKEENPSLGVKLLADLKSVFADRDAMSTSAILAALNALPESPWNEINKGQPLNDRGLSSRLRQYEIKSKTVRAGPDTAKGYTRSSLWDAWERYLPSTSAPPIAGASVTSDTSDTSEQNQGLICVGKGDFHPTQEFTDPTQEGPVSDSENRVSAKNGRNDTKNVNEINDVTVVTLVTPHSGREPEPPGEVCEFCMAPGEVLPHHNGDEVVMLHRDCWPAWLEPFSLTHVNPVGRIRGRNMRAK